MRRSGSGRFYSREGSGAHAQGLGSGRFWYSEVLDGSGADTYR